MIEYFLNDQSIEALGWTLLHSLWQGAAFAIFLVLILIALRSYSAHSRYIVSVGLLCAFFLTLSTTFWLQWQDASTRLEMSDAYLNQQPEYDSFILNEQTTTESPSDNEIINTLPTNSDLIESGQSSWLISFRDYYQKHLPLLVTIWLLGVLVLQLRFLGQLAYVQRLKHYGTQLFPESWNDKIDELEGKLRIQKKVAYLTSMRIESPMVIGWLKPVVLMPRQLLTSLTETEIYAVLAHELAHIRREDFIVNLLQTFLCNVFFFHPGVWWMSNRIDEEREHCCDDLAVAATGPATSYAKTLINVSELQLRLQRDPQLAMALSGNNIKRERGGFADRIRRLFMVNNGAGTFREGFATAIILIAALFLGVAATGTTVQDADSTDSSEITDTENVLNNENPNNLELDLNTEIITSTGSGNLPVSSIDQVNADGLPIAPTVKPVAPVRPDQPRIDALVMACKEGDFDFVQTLIKSGIDVNSIGSNGFTPLMMATSHDEEKIVSYLLKQGADVNKSYNGWTALIEAADEGAVKSMKLLLNAGADVNYYRTFDSQTAISMAASEGNLECLELLLDYGADMNGVGRSVPPLHNAAEEDQMDIINYLLTNKVIVNKKDAVGRTALMLAAYEGHKSVVIKLINNGADIFIRDINGATARDYADREDNYDLRDYLGAGKRPAMHQATLDGLIEKVERMVENGTDVNTTDADGRTPLHIASAEGHTNDMLTLINLGADVNAQDRQGRTSLMYAAEDGQGDAVSLLVSRLANVNIADRNGRRAFEWARAGGYTDLTNFLGLITEKNPLKDLNKDRLKSDAKNRTLQKTNREEDPKPKPRNEEDWLNNGIPKEHQQLVREIIRETEQAVNKAVQKEVLQKETFHVAADGTHLRQYNLDDDTPVLLELVRKGSIADIRELLHVELDINATDATGQTALMAAARANRLDIAKLLIQNLADVNKSSASGLTALHYAALENHHEMAQLLLDNNANVDATMRYSSTDGNFGNEPLVWEYVGATPLLIAVEAGRTKVISVLIEAGANINHSLIRNEYRLNNNRESYLTGSEVMGLDGDFLKDVKFKNSDDTWTPYKHVLLLNKPEILALFKQ